MVRGNAVWINEQLSLRAPALSACLDFPQCWTVDWKGTPIKPFPPSVALGQDVYDSSRMNTGYNTHRFVDMYMFIVGNSGFLTDTYINTWRCRALFPRRSYRTAPGFTRTAQSVDSENTQE